MNTINKIPDNLIATPLYKEWEIINIKCRYCNNDKTFLSYSNFNDGCEEDSKHYCDKCDNYWWTDGIVKGTQK